MPSGCRRLAARGVVIPWEGPAALWRINIRRSLSPAQQAAGEPKYMGPPGYANGLYNAGSLAAHKPVVLVEGDSTRSPSSSAAGNASRGDRHRLHLRQPPAGVGGQAGGGPAGARGLRP